MRSRAWSFTVVAASFVAACGAPSGQGDVNVVEGLPWCADGVVALDRLPVDAARAWQDGDFTAVLDAADAAWTTAAAEIPGLFHPTLEGQTVDVAPADPDAAQTGPEDPSPAPTPVADDEAASQAAAAVRVERARALREWTREWRDAPRPVVDVGLDRFVPAPDLTEAAIEAALAIGDADAVDRWLRRAGTDGGDRPELAACVASVTRRGGPS